MIEIKNVMVYRNKVNVSLSEASDRSLSSTSSSSYNKSASEQLFTNLNDSSLNTVDMFYAGSLTAENQYGSSLIKS